MDDPGDLALHRLLSRAGRAAARWERRAAAGHGLTPTGMAALAHLAAAGPCGHRDLAAALHLAPATLTPVVDDLERAGYAERVRDRADRRVVRVAATAAGLRRTAEAAPAVDALADGVLPGPDRDVVRRWLLAALAVLDGGDSPEAHGRPAPPPPGEVEARGEGPHGPVDVQDGRHLGRAVAGMVDP